MSLKERLSNLTKEEFDEKWERLKHYNEIGPNVREYVEEMKKSYDSRRIKEIP